MELSGSRESNPDHTHPMRAHYHYATPRINDADYNKYKTAGAFSPAVLFISLPYSIAPTTNTKKSAAVMTIKKLKRNL